MNLPRRSTLPAPSQPTSFPTKRRSLLATLAALSSTQAELISALTAHLSPPASSASTAAPAAYIYPYPTYLPSTATHTLSPSSTPNLRCSPPSASAKKAALALANETTRAHIRRLHAYNEMRDVGQGLLGIVAEQRGVRVKEVMEEFGVEDED